MSRHDPLVSVYLVNHNYGRFIEQAIHSVLSQTMQDFELIVIDDGSTDDSRDIIERYATHEKIITIFQQNQGLNVTNNIALRATVGAYIMRLDAGDYLDENALAVLSGVLERRPDVGLVFPDYYHIDESGRVVEVVRRRDFTEARLLDQPAHGACTMIRRECLEEIGGYDEAFRCQDGWDLWVRFIEHYEVQNVNLPLFYYRRHEASLTRDEEHILATRAEILRKNAARLERPLNCVAVIPVRGKPTDPHSRALHRLGGKALIDWTVEAALESRNLSQVIVTSPDEDILGHVERTFGDAAYIDHRDWKLALPNTLLDDTLDHIFGRLPESLRDFHAVITLFVESPFRSARYIDMAADAMKLFETDRVIGVRVDTETYYRHTGDGLVPLNQSGMLRLESDELFRQVGGFNLIRRGHFPSRVDPKTERIGHVVLDRPAALHLDSDWNWEIAEAHAAKLVDQSVKRTVSQGRGA